MTSARVDVGCVPAGRRVDHDGHEVEEEDGEDGEEVCEGVVEHDAVEVEGVGAVVMPVEHVSVLHPVVSEYHVLRIKVRSWTNSQRLSKNPYQYDIDQAVEEFFERAGFKVEAPLNLGDVVVENAAAEGGIVDGRPHRAVLQRVRAVSAHGVVAEVARIAGVAGDVLELLRNQNEAEDEERGQKVEEDGPLEDMMMIKILINFIS